MRKAKKLVTDTAAMERIIQKARVCRVAFCRDGRPYIVPVNFGYEDGRIYIHTGYEGKKIEYLKANPRVCFEVDVDVEVRIGDRPCKSTCDYLSVVGYGEARLLLDPEEKTDALDVIMSRYGPGPHDYDPEMVKKTAVIEIEVSSMTGRCSGYDVQDL